MKNRKTAPLYPTLAIGFFLGVLFLGVCIDSDTRTAFAHGIINAFGIEYDNQVSGLVAADVQAAIDENATIDSGLESRVAKLEAAGGPNPCDPNGDGAITHEEMHDYTTDNGLPFSLNTIYAYITLAEGSINSPKENQILDTPAEVNEFNGMWLIPNGVSACVYP